VAPVENLTLKEHDRFKQAVRSNVGDERGVLVWQHLGYKRCQVVNSESLRHREPLAPSSRPTARR
jgi:hypothetical protein